MDQDITPKPESKTITTPPLSPHKFPYRWTLQDASFKKNKGKVFSCFACGGGSSMGYKLAGFDVLGCNEIDSRMIKLYIKNLAPRYAFEEPIQTFKSRDDLPLELYDLDILDGSPPCSVFSMAGDRDKDWGKSRKFAEGQKEQILDTLFFDFIDLGKKLQPKVMIAENVMGILYGKAKKYVYRIMESMDDAGYACSHFVLDSSFMGVPQKRMRVFFIAIKKEICRERKLFGDMFQTRLNIKMDFAEPVIPFRDIEDPTDTSTKTNTKVSEYWSKTDNGKSFSQTHPQRHYFNDNRVHPLMPLPVIHGQPHHGSWHYAIQRPLNTKELISGSSFPQDYDFMDQAPKYIMGMSVPPVMMANIASSLWEQINGEKT